MEHLILIPQDSFLHPGPSASKLLASLPWKPSSKIIHCHVATLLTSHAKSFQRNPVLVTAFDKETTSLQKNSNSQKFKFIRWFENYIWLGSTRRDSRGTTHGITLYSSPHITCCCLSTVYCSSSDFTLGNLRVALYVP
jgi:hypothetical protein